MFNIGKIVAFLFLHSSMEEYPIPAMMMMMMKMTL